MFVADAISAEGLAHMEGNGLSLDVEHGLTGAKLAAKLRKSDAVVVRSATKIRADVLDEKSSVKVIGRAGIGVDNIDVSRATELGVVVLNTPDANAKTTAELAVAHIFSLSRNLTLADASVRAGTWERSRFTGTEIAGKTVGVVGYGTIGRMVAEICRAIGLAVLVHDPFVADSVIDGDGHAPSALAKLLKSSDYVTIHTPGSKETMGLIGAKELGMMKKSAYVIQCARGGIVDEGALAKELKSGGIAGAAVDVFTTEPVAPDNVLLKAPNVAFTPHLGASTAEAQRATGLAIARQLVTYFTTGEAVNAVNLPRVPAEQLEVSRPYLPLARGLGRLLAASCDAKPEALELCMDGFAADLPESVIMSEVLAGFLEPIHSVPVNQVNAISLAERSGIKLSVAKRHAPSEFATLLSLELRCGKRASTISGTLLGGAQPRIASYDGIELEAPLSGQVLLTVHDDRPGVVAMISTLLSKRRINITHMHVGSDAKGKQAAAFIRLDRMLPDELFKEISKARFVKSAMHLSL